MMEFDDILLQYGGDPASLLRFDSDRPELLPYATLTTARRSDSSELSALRGVYEWQSSPLFFLVDGSQLENDPLKLLRIRRLVAMRGDAPYLAVVNPGSLSIYQVTLDSDLAQACVPVSENCEQQQIVIPNLANTRPQTSANRRWISDVILRLLTAALSEMSVLGVADGDAISLVGRALFVRFLADRNILPEAVCAVAPSGASTLFDSAMTTTAISSWLDETFNGDFLPITIESINSAPQDVFRILGHILRRAPEGQLQLDWREKWDMLDFAYIPVGVLSQAYERYLSHHQPEKQRKEGGFYTPRHIAELMVRASFSALACEGQCHKTRVLDPAVGAGVFLLTAFRQLVAERWHHDQKRPDTETLREILYNQISGFDINESALRFAALGLYLISIELDPNPEPIKKLRFKNLRNSVLFKFGNNIEETQCSSLGSLGDDVGKEHIGAYDLVIGNPPWATSTKLSNWSSLENKISGIARERLRNPQARAPIPNEVLDLPFVWRALEWARPSGQIAFALHARLLFQRGETMPEARNALFGSLDITGIVNGTELRKTRVWPEITAPFCLLFARNAAPSPGAGFRFTSPHLEGPLNQSGAWRIDASNAEIVSIEDVRRRPELLKILFRGTRLDLELYDRIASKGFPTLEQYWSDRFGTSRGRLKYTGNGYQRLRDSSQASKSGDGLPGLSAVYLEDLPEVPNTPLLGMLLAPADFDKFNKPRVHRGRPRELFKGPLLLVREAPPVSAGRIKTSVSTEDVIFNQSYHGYTAHTHKHGEELVRFLALIIGSKISLWHALITSGRFGFEREVVEKFIIDESPVPIFEELTETNRKAVSELFNMLVANDSEASWKKIDQWVGSLFGLSSDDIETITDTLEYRLPFSVNVKASQQPASPAQKNAFKDRLELELKPWAKRFDQALSIQKITTPPASPWSFLQIARNTIPDDSRSNNIDWMQAMRLADELSATEIIYTDKTNNTLILGRLNQARYWTPSQARLTARRIIWDHVYFLSGQDAL